MVSKELFGKLPDGSEVNRYTITNRFGESAGLLDFGATIHDVTVLDKDGKLGDVVLGAPADAIAQCTYMGSIIGRYSGRVPGGKCMIDGKSHQLEQNLGEDFCHGASGNYARKLFNGQCAGDDTVTFTLLDQGEGGFGDQMDVTVTYTFGDDHCLRLTIAMIVGALFATIAGFIVGAPVLRLQGDYLAIVTLAFGEIIKELVTCLIVGHDENGLHILFNLTGNKTVEDLGLSDTGIAIIKGAQGTASVKTIASFTAGFILVMVTLFIVLNLKHSRAGRAIMALRDNRIATSSIGINTTKYKLMAFVTSAALAGAAGALYGLNYSSLQAAKFNFNTSILVLVFVVLGGLGNIWGSLVAAAALTILPEALREFADYRMLVYAIVLILVMLATHNPTLQSFFARLKPGKKEEKEAA